MLSCSIWFSAPSFWMGGGLESQIGTVPIWPRCREVALPILRPVPEAAVTVLSTPDDGCCDTRNM